MPDEPHADIRRRFARGDHEAFRVLFRQFEREVFRWVIRIVRDPEAAREVVVDAFWRAYRGHATFDPARGFGAWMRRIATNAALDHLRAARRPADSTFPDGRLPAAPSTDPEMRAVIRRAFRTLSPKLMLVARLALIEERPYGEIADALGVPLGTVKSRVFRAVRALRHELARLGVHR